MGGATTELARIPFNRLTPVGRELEYLADAIARGHVAGDGSYTRKCQDVLQSIVGAERALLTTSCTHALEMSALLLDIQTGDEVIVPSFTFVSTANAFVLRGATPVFADVRADTLNLDESKLADLVTPRTRAIVPVHYAGVACEMDDLMRVATAHGLAIVEDNAHGLLGRYKGRPLGSFGAMSTLSFHETKNISCGEGGALILNDAALAERAEIIREKGTDRSKFFRGQVDKYSWVDVGSSYPPSDMLAAFLFAQLEARDTIQAARGRVWRRYDEELRTWATAHDIRQPIVPDGCEHPFHLYYLLLPSLEWRQALIDHLKRRQILAVFHYVPLHLSTMGQRFGARPRDCPVAESVGDRLVRLPLFVGLTDDEQSRVIDAILAFDGP